MSECEEVAEGIRARHGATLPTDPDILRRFVAALMPGESTQIIDNVTEALQATGD